MAVYKKDEVIGFETEQGFFCTECIPGDAKISDALTESNRDDALIYVCDGCREEI